MTKPTASQKRARLKLYRPRSVLPKRRPGAPKGNLNALKSGASSRHFKLLSRLLLDHPDLQGVEASTALVAKLMPDILRQDAAEHKAAVRRARRILAPYQPERFTERITHRIVVAVLRHRAKPS